MGLDDKMSNKAEDLKGQAKESYGSATDDEELQAEGKGDQASASLKNGVEHAKDAADDVKDGLKNKFG